MFFRVKSARSYQYLQIVHSMRQGEKVRQQVFGTLGRLDELKASGRLEALMRSGLRHCEKFAVIDAHAVGETQAVTVQRIGPDLVFERLWKECGIQEVIQSLLKTRRYDFDVDTATSAVAGLVFLLDKGLAGLRDRARKGLLNKRGLNPEAMTVKEMETQLGPMLAADLEQWLEDHQNEAL